MSSRFHSPTVVGVDTFSHVFGANHLSNLDAVIEEGNRLFPCVLPEFGDRGIPGAPLLFQSVEGVLRCVRVWSGIDMPEVTFEPVSILPGSKPK